MIDPMPEHVGARAVRAVERKHPRRDLGIRDAALDAGEALAEVDLAVASLPFEPFDLEQVVAVLEGDLQRVAQALLDPAANRQAIDHHLDGVALVLVERDLLAQFDAAVPSILTRTKPARRRSLSSLRYSPLRSRTIGASTWMRVPSGHAMMRSTICCTLCCVISRPQLWQKAWPTRANSRRR